MLSKYPASFLIYKSSIFESINFCEASKYSNFPDAFHLPFFPLLQSPKVDFSTTGKTWVVNFLKIVINNKMFYYLQKAFMYFHNNDSNSVDVLLFQSSYIFFPNSHTKL